MDYDRELYLEMIVKGVLITTAVIFALLVGGYL